MPKSFKTPEQLAQDALHHGHRDRLKQEFMAGKLDPFLSPHKMLELLLFFCISRCDTNPLAHQLLNRYGSIANVLNAPVSELIQFKGLTESNVVLLKMIMPIARVYNYDQLNTKASFRNYEEIGNFLYTQYLGLTTERLSILCLDGFGRILKFQYLSDGDQSSVSVSMRTITETAIQSQATHVILAHNHPKASALPSRADINVTRQVSDLLAQLNIYLIDHIIISGSDYVSLAQSQQFHDIFTGGLSFKPDCSKTD